MVEVKKISKMIRGWFLCLMMLFMGMHVKSAYLKAEENGYLTYLNQIVTWEKVQLQLGERDDLFLYEFVEEAGQSSTDWYAFSMGRSGYKGDYGAYLNAVSEMITQEYDRDKTLVNFQPTDLQRMTLTIASLGGDVCSVGEKKIDIFHMATYGQRKENLEKQGVNAKIWALLTMNAFEIQEPENATVTKQWLQESLIKHQNKDGSFSMETGEVGDVDLTAMAVQAFSGCMDHKETEKSVEKALTWLSKKQTKSGGFESWDKENVESSCQVLMALCMLGKNCTKEKMFIKNGNHLLDAIFKYSRPDGGFAHEFESENSDPMAGQQVFEAITAYVRMMEGKRALFDLREEKNCSDETYTRLEHIVSVFQSKEEIKVHYEITQSEIEEIKHLPTEVTTKDEGRILVLWEHLENSKGRKEYEECFKVLKDRKERIVNTKKKITKINEVIMKYFYPDFKNGKENNPEKWKEIVEIYETLGEYDCTQVFQNEMLFLEENDVTNENSYWWIIVPIVIGGVICVGALWKGRRKHDLQNRARN